MFPSFMEMLVTIGLVAFFFLAGIVICGCLSARYHGKPRRKGRG